MIEAESKIESRLAVPGTFRIDEYRAARPNQDVFRADIAMHQCAFGCERGARKRLKLRRQIGMDASRRDQIRLEPNGVETGAGIERGCYLGPAGGCGVNRNQPLGDRDRGFFAQDAVAQLALPVRITIGIEIVHDEEAGVPILRHKMRDRAWPDRLRRGEPLPFGVVALDRRFPNLRHLELWQGTLQAIFSRADLDAPDVGRNSAFERYAYQLVAGRKQAHAPKEDRKSTRLNSS